MKPGLSWLPNVDDVAMLVNIEGENVRDTGWRLKCDRHWDTGAPDEWLAVRLKPMHMASFETAAEARTYAEVTYELG